ncbi:MAG: flagellar export chaperone FlgN [Bacillota bacterium]|nr:flagellar export chaperone FlgN [Bacillota bacterium]
MKMKRFYQLMAELVSGYKLQLRRFHEMRDLARRQQELMRPGGILQLDEIFARRQALMEEIDETGRKLAGFREEVQQIFHLEEFKLEKLEKLVNVPSCAELKETLRELAGLIEEIQRYDRESALLLEKDLKAVRESLRDIRDNRTAHRAYQGSFSDGGSVLDLKK